MITSRKAQSTLEYILVFTAIIGAILVAANTIIKPRVTEMVDHVSTEAVNAVSHVNFK